MQGQTQPQGKRKLISLRRLIALFFILWAVTLIWHQVKPMPAGTVASCEFHPVRQDQIQFLHDLTYTDSNGQQVNDQTIFDTVFRIIDQAERFIVMDFFLINQFRGEAGEIYRNLSSELVERIIQRKQERPDLRIILITDPINSIYGGRVSPLSAMAGYRIHFRRMLKKCPCAAG